MLRSKVTSICLLAILIVSSAQTPAISQDRIIILHQTFEGEIVGTSDLVNSETFGYAAEAFIPNCDVWLRGEYLDQVPSPYCTHEYGVHIEKTKHELIFNGTVYLSFAEPGPHVFSEAKRNADDSTTMGIAAKSFRDEAIVKTDTAGGYIFRGVSYLPEVPTVLIVDEKDDSVVVTVRPKYMGNTDYIFVEHRGSTAGFSLYKGPRPSAAQLNEQSLDSAFRNLANRCKPGRLVLIGRGYSDTYTSSDHDKLLSALEQIPELAVPWLRNSRGEQEYYPLSIDGFEFQPSAVRDFVESTRSLNTTHPAPASADNTGAN